MHNASGTRTAMIAALVGAAVGVVVGFLTAPRSGREVRGLIRQKTGEMRCRAQEVVSRAKPGELVARVKGGGGNGGK